MNGNYVNHDCLWFLYVPVVSSLMVRNMFVLLFIFDAIYLFVVE